jgi:hypothetical protein
VKTGYLGGPSPLGAVRRNRRNCEDNININIKEVGRQVVNWIHVSENKVK